MTASQRDAALAAGALAMEIAKWIEQQFVVPECKLFDLRGYTPEAAAETLRAKWGLGETPIKNVIHLLEAHGVRVFSLAEECRNIDAFSFWRSSTPFIFLNTLKSAERSRFDALHELGHLVLHRSGGPAGREAEQEADAFAAAMLMPRASVLAAAPRVTTLPLLIKLKRRWNASLAAVVHRLHALRLLTDWQYRTLCVQVAQSGYRLREPNSCPRETSLLLRKAFVMARQEGMTRQVVADQLCISAPDLDALIFGLVLVGIDGGVPPSAARSSSSKPDLRLINSGRR